MAYPEMQSAGASYGQSPIAPQTQPSCITNEMSGSMELVAKLNNRLSSLKDRMGMSQINKDAGQSSPPPCQILQMAATLNSGLIVAHHTLDEIEKLLG